jgi:hypothetical protein
MPRSGTSSWGGCIPAQPRPRGEVADVCWRSLSITRAVHTTSPLPSIPPYPPSRPPLRSPRPPAVHPAHTRGRPCMHRHPCAHPWQTLHAPTHLRTPVADPACTDTPAHTRGRPCMHRHTCAHPWQTLHAPTHLRALVLRRLHRRLRHHLVRADGDQRGGLRGDLRHGLTLRLLRLHHRERE